MLEHGLAHFACRQCGESLVVASRARSDGSARHARAGAHQYCQHRRRALDRADIRDHLGEQIGDHAQPRSAVDRVVVAQPSRVERPRHRRWPCSRRLPPGRGSRHPEGPERSGSGQPGVRVTLLRRTPACACFGSDDRVPQPGTDQTRGRAQQRQRFPSRNRHRWRAARADCEASSPTTRAASIASKVTGSSLHHPEAARLSGAYAPRFSWINAPSGRGKPGIASVRPIGGAAIGRHAGDGVVDHRGEVFGHRGLHVADGSLYPRSPGVPPSLTIAALVERQAALMLLE
jgi:hypothetical protein